MAMNRQTIVFELWKSRFDIYDFTRVLDGLFRDLVKGPLFEKWSTAPEFAERAIQAFA